MGLNTCSWQEEGEEEEDASGRPLWMTMGTEAESTRGLGRGPANPGVGGEEKGLNKGKEGAMGILGSGQRTGSL